MLLESVCDQLETMNSDDDDEDEDSESGLESADSVIDLSQLSSKERKELEKQQKEKAKQEKKRLEQEKKEKEKAEKQAEKERKEQEKKGGIASRLQAMCCGGGRTLNY